MVMMMIWVGNDRSLVTSSLLVTPSMTPRHQPGAVSPRKKKEMRKKGREKRERRRERGEGGWTVDFASLFLYKGVRMK